MWRAAMANDADILVACALLAIAAASDVASRRIPNSLVLMVATIGLGVRASQGGVACASSLAASLFAGAVVFVAWRRGIMGGGDVKLAAATGAWVGLGRLPQFMLAVALAGGVIAVLTWGAVVIRRGAGAEGSSGARARVPYGVAIAFGAASALVGR